MGLKRHYGYAWNFPKIKLKNICLCTMGSKRLCIGVLVLFGCFCDAQWGYQSLDTNANHFGMPTYTQAPVVARQTFGKPAYTQAPVVTRPTFGKPAYTQAPVVTRPTFGKPAYTQAPVTARPTFGKPAYTQAPVTARPTFGKPAYTQAPVTARPTFGKPAYTQAPVTARPTFGGPKVPTIPVAAPTPNPIPAKVYCGESSVQIEVDMDLLGIGHVIQPSDITLGGCGPVAQDESTGMLLFETELHDCGSVLAVGSMRFMWVVLVCG